VTQHSEMAVPLTRRERKQGQRQGRESGPAGQSARDVKGPLHRVCFLVSYCPKFGNNRGGVLLSDGVVRGKGNPSGEAPGVGVSSRGVTTVGGGTDFASGSFSSLPRSSFIRSVAISKNFVFG